MSDETQHFDGTIHKITADGKRVASSYLDPGEELVSEATDEASKNLQAKVDTSASPAASEPVTSDNQTSSETDPAQMNKPDLVKYADSKGVDSTGTKEEILARLK